MQHSMSSSVGQVGLRALSLDIICDVNCRENGVMLRRSSTQHSHARQGVIKAQAIGGYYSWELQHVSL